MNIKLVLKLAYLWATKQTPERALADLNRTLLRLESGMDSFGKIIDTVQIEIDERQVMLDKFNTEREQAETVVRNIRVNIFGDTAYSVE